MTLKDPDATSGDLATLVDVGGIFGAIIAGLVADVTKSSALTCAVWLVFSISMVSSFIEYLFYVTLVER